MTAKIQLTSSDGKTSIREFEVTLRNVKSTRGLRETIESRLQGDEDVVGVTMNGKFFKGIENVPLDDLKMGDTLKIHLDKTLKVDVQVNTNGHGKPYKVEVSRMDTTEDVRKKIENKLPFQTQIGDVGNGSKVFSNGRTMGSQMNGDQRYIHASTKVTGG